VTQGSPQALVQPDLIGFDVGFGVDELVNLAVDCVAAITGDKIKKDAINKAANVITTFLTIITVCEINLW
jgi:hypothetical protein